MQQGFAGQTSVFWFDHYWWLLWLVLFSALLMSSITHRKGSYCKGDRVLRHDLPARFGHWSNAAGILLLLYSGYKLGFLFIPRELISTDEIRLFFNLHFIGAALFLLGAVYWLGNMFVEPKRLTQHEPYQGSLKDAVLHYLHLAGLVKHAGTPTGKYEASERLAFVPLTLLAFIMAITGLVKMSVRVWHVPDSVLVASTAIHNWGSVALAILLVFHIALAAGVPWAWPLMRSMITGFVSLEFVKEGHQGWYKELKESGACKGEDDEH